jgi:DNA-binding transcriptional LysR family regulator
MNEFLAQATCDIHGLHVFRLVAETGGFTRAGEKAGLTQSAVTRQIQGMEQRLGVMLFERTTRQVRLTDAGRFLYGEALKLIEGLENSLQELHQRYADSQKVLRVGISTTIGLAYLPGFFNAYRKRFPEVHTEVTSASSASVMEGVQEGKLDAGLVCTPSAQGRMPKSLKVTHRFNDDFSLIAPPGFTELPSILETRDLVRIASSARWILVADATHTGKLLRAWLADHDIAVNPVIESESFDFIVNLVSLGMGISLVPNRALPLYLRQRTLTKVPCRPRFSREIAVVIRKSRQSPEHVSRFVDEILY